MFVVSVSHPAVVGGGSVCFTIPCSGGFCGCMNKHAFFILTKPCVFGSVWLGALQPWAGWSSEPTRAAGFAKQVARTNPRSKSRAEQTGSGPAFGPFSTAVPWVRGGAAAGRGPQRRAAGTRPRPWGCPELSCGRTRQDYAGARGWERCLVGVPGLTRGSAEWCSPVESTSTVAFVCSSHRLLNPVTLTRGLLRLRW